MCSCILWLAISLAGQARFERHAIDAFPAGYQAAAADVDRDGKLDVLALSTRMNRVVWYKNPNWQQYPIASTPQDIDVAPLDFDRDGRRELALATGFYFDEPAAAARSTCSGSRPT